MTLEHGSASWKDRLAAARAQHFVGRVAELALWQEALEAEEPPFAVLWVVGPGGVGKTTLLQRLASLSRSFGVEPVALDARVLVGTRASFLELLAERLGVLPSEVPTAFAGPRKALLIDTAEDLGEVQDWLREEFLPKLPSQTLVAIAGRSPPTAAWRTDAAWATLLRVLGLRNLSASESRKLLEARGIDPTGQARTLVDTHGHPLTLALIADVLQQDPTAVSLDLRAHPNVVSALLARLVHAAPDELHRRALAVAAHLRVTHEGALRHALGVEDARHIFDWLASMSFVVPHSEGLHLHDLAAHALDADHRRRDPEGYVAMHSKLRAPIIERLRATSGAERYRAAMDLSWMHRFSAIMGAVVDWEGARSLTPAALEPRDIPEIVAATRRFEGEEAARLIERWAREQPQAFTMVRASPTRTLGYVAALTATGAQQANSGAREDPRMRSLLEHAARNRALRADDRLELCLWLAYETHVDPSAMVSQLSIANIQSWLSLPGITWGGCAIPARLDAWRPMMGYLDYHATGDVTLGSTRYALFAHDWRTVPPIAFLDMMAQREISHAADDSQLQPPREVLALEHEEFCAQVKQALKDFCSDDALARSPLSRCRFALDAPHAGGLPLRTAIELATDTLTRSGKDEPLHAALKITYLDPARTQEEAAQLLGLSFSTYRRQLAAGVERVTAWLWQRDLHGYGPQPEGGTEGTFK